MTKPKSAPPVPPGLTVPDLLREGAETYEGRNSVYGNSYKQFGAVMLAFFPDGLTLQTAEEWNRVALFFHCTGKLARYAPNLLDGGHADSAHDLMVYAAMLRELTTK